MLGHRDGASLWGHEPWRITATPAGLAAACRACKVAVAELSVQWDLDVSGLLTQSWMRLPEDCPRVF